MLFGLKNPSRKLKTLARWLPSLFWMGVVISLVGGLWAVGFAPPDYQQGHTFKILYVHVPSSWLALFWYGMLASLCGAFWIWKSRIALSLAQGAACVGAVFTAISLVTGSLWGKPMWGTWWVWDARLTSMLILFFLYLGFLALQRADPWGERGAKLSSLFAMIGALNLPIIKGSVTWWATLHQGASVVRLGGPSIHATMLMPLLVVAVGLLLLSFSLVMMRGMSHLAATKKSLKPERPLSTHTLE